MADREQAKPLAEESPPATSARGTTAWQAAGCGDRPASRTAESITFVALRATGQTIPTRKDEDLLIGSWRRSFGWKHCGG